MPEVDVSTSTVIDCPLHRVAGFSVDPDNVPKWYVNIKSVEWKTPRPAVVGSQIAFVAQFLGRRLAYTYEIVELFPNERLVMRTAEGPFPMETSYRWEAVTDSSTRMTLRNRGKPSGFSALMAPFMPFMMRRAYNRDLAMLKQLLESTQEQTMSVEDEALIERIRSILKRRKGYSEKKMFGGVCFMINGNMCVGSWKGSLIVRLDKAKHDETQSEPYVKPMNITGKVMKGWGLIEPAGFESDEDLMEWIGRAVKFARSLPTK